VNRLEELEQRIASREVEIAVIGLGYVGLPLALAFAEKGFRVFGLDIDADRVAQLQAGRSHVGDVADADVAREVEAGRLIPTTSYAEAARADCIQICVPTPLTKTKDPDVSFIVSAVEGVKQHLRSGQLVILGSTTYPGTTRDLYRPMLEEGGLRVGEDFCLAFAPERIDPANRDFALNEVPKVVGGETPLCTRLASKLYEAIFDRVVQVSSSESAEMVKLLENTFRMINIGLANEVAMICHRLGLDVWEVIDAAATKPYGFMKFVPGPGLGGHCIPVDPNYLAWKMRSLDYTARFIETASEINSAMPAWVVDRIARILNEDERAVKGSSILLLGLAYKPDVSDTRESPAIDIVVMLQERGAAVLYHDPLIPETELGGRPQKSIELTDEALRSADLVVVTTAHSGVDYARVARLARRVLDTRNATGGVPDATNIEKL
jgi:UDP-N-acetyl-D-glucosamine dehydrogenase